MLDGGTRSRVLEMHPDCVEATNPDAAKGKDFFMRPLLERIK